MSFSGKIAEAARQALDGAEAATQPVGGAGAAGAAMQPVDGTGTAGAGKQPIEGVPGQPSPHAGPLSSQMLGASGSQQGHSSSSLVANRPGSDASASDSDAAPSDIMQVDNAGASEAGDDEHTDDKDDLAPCHVPISDLPEFFRVAVPVGSWWFNMNFMRQGELSEANIKFCKRMLTSPKNSVQRRLRFITMMALSWPRLLMVTRERMAEEKRQDMIASSKKRRNAALKAKREAETPRTKLARIAKRNMGDLARQRRRRQAAAAAAAAAANPLVLVDGIAGPDVADPSPVVDVPILAEDDLLSVPDMDPDEEPAGPAAGAGNIVAERDEH